jgi:hypothetical protein
VRAMLTTVSPQCAACCAACARHACLPVPTRAMGGAAAARGTADVGAVFNRLSHKPQRLNERRRACQLSTGGFFARAHLCRPHSVPIGIVIFPDRVQMYIYTFACTRYRSGAHTHTTAGPHRRRRRYRPREYIQMRQCALAAARRGGLSGYRGYRAIGADHRTCPPTPPAACCCRHRRCHRHHQPSLPQPSLAPPSQPLLLMLLPAPPPLAPPALLLARHPARHLTRSRCRSTLLHAPESPSQVSHRRGRGNAPARSAGTGLVSRHTHTHKRTPQKTQKTHANHTNVRNTPAEQNQRSVVQSV